MSYIDDDLDDDVMAEDEDDSIDNSQIDISEIRAVIEDLTTTINLANLAYLFTNHPIMDDALYDEYVEELKRLEEYYPQFKSLNSPNDKLKLRRGNPSRIIRMDKTYKDPAVIQLDNNMYSEQVVSFLKKIQDCYNSQNTLKSLNNAPLALVHIVHSYKAIPVVLVYKEGRLFNAISRGDGQSGADLTHTVSTIINVPTALNAFETELHPDGLIIRGDIVMPTKSYKRYVSDMAEKGDYLDDSIRAMNRIVYHEDNSLMIKYPLTFLAREVLSTDPGTILDQMTTHTSCVEYMEMLGFQCLPTRIVESDINTINENINSIYQQRSSFPYPILGVTIRADNIKVQEEMQAEASSNTRAWEIKLLYPMRRLIMRVEDINWTLDNHDSIMPSFLLLDTTNNQTQITRLTNLNELLRHIVSIGDIIDCLVRGTNDLIEITHIVNHHNGSKPITIIENCPTCNFPLVKRDHQLMCVNQNCEIKKINSISRYLSVNDKDSIALPIEMRNTILSLVQIPHPLKLFSSKVIKELLHELTTVLETRQDITLQPDVTASQFLTNIIPHPTLTLADLLCVLGVTDSVNSVFVQEYGLKTLADLFGITEFDLRLNDFLKPHEIEGLLVLISNPELINCVKVADLDHHLIK
jgi:DNA ligase (NAD+)